MMHILHLLGNVFLRYKSRNHQGIFWKNIYVFILAYDCPKVGMANFFLSER